MRWFLCLWLYCECVFIDVFLLPLKFHKELSSKSIKLKPVGVCLLKVHDEWRRSSVKLWKKHCNKKKGTQVQISCLIPFRLEFDPVTCCFWAWVVSPCKYEGHGLTWKEAEIWVKPLVFPVLPRSELFVTICDFLILISFIFFNSKLSWNKKREARQVTLPKKTFCIKENFLQQ